MDGIAGTALAAPRPPAANCSSESSVSFSSQMPMPSTPAARYASRSSAKLAPRVLTCEIENRGTPMGRILRARLTSDQVWFRVRVRGHPARCDPAPPDDGGGGVGAPPRGDHHGR